MTARCLLFFRLTCSLLEKAEVEQQVLEDDFAENPLSSFHTLFRIYHDWNEVFRHIWCNDCDKTHASQGIQIHLQTVNRLFVDCRFSLFFSFRLFLLFAPFQTLTLHLG